MVPRDFLNKLRRRPGSFAELRTKDRVSHACLAGERRYGERPTTSEKGVTRHIRGLGTLIVMFEEMKTSRKRAHEVAGLSTSATRADDGEKRSLYDPGHGEVREASY